MSSSSASLINGYIVSVNPVVVPSDEIIHSPLIRILVIGQRRSGRGKFIDWYKGISYDVKDNRDHSLSERHEYWENISIYTTRGPVRIEFINYGQSGHLNESPFNGTFCANWINMQGVIYLKEYIIQGIQNQSHIPFSWRLNGMINFFADAMKDRFVSCISKCDHGEFLNLSLDEVNNINNGYNANYRISTKKGYNVEKPVLHILRRIYNDPELHYAQAPIKFENLSSLQQSITSIQRPTMILSNDNDDNKMLIIQPNYTAKPKWVLRKMKDNDGHYNLFIDMMSGLVAKNLDNPNAVIMDSHASIIGFWSNDKQNVIED